MTDAIYFVQRESGAIKIGTTGNVRRRLATLQTGSNEPLTLLGYIQGDKATESALHNEFGRDRLSGEWFKPSDALLSRIKSLLNNEVAPSHSQNVAVIQPDLLTQLAAQYAEKSSARIAVRDKCSTLNARRTLAGLAGIQPGTIENLGRGRLSAISASDFESIRAAYETLVIEELAEMESLLAALKREPTRDGVASVNQTAMVEVETHLAAVRALLKEGAR